jgi:hypothetical protein
VERIRVHVCYGSGVPPIIYYVVVLERMDDTWKETRLDINVYKARKA